MQTYAVRALEANEESDARRFLEEKAKLSKNLAHLEENYNIAKTNSEKMRDMHDKLVVDIAELESRKDVIKGKLNVAKARERMNKMVSSSLSSGSSSIANFQRYEDMANAALDKANAMAELNQTRDENNINDLIDKYSNTPSSDIDNELEALKASLKKE